MPTDRPILFSGPMVRAIIEGRKTQTRRIVKPQPDDAGLWNHTDLPMSMQSELVGWIGTSDGPGESRRWKCPYGAPGDRLWVRETWDATPATGGASIIYSADGVRGFRTLPAGYQLPMYAGLRLQPSIHMPRHFSRLTLEVVSVRVERLQDITLADIEAEGALEVSNGWFESYYDYDDWCGSVMPSDIPCSRTYEREWFLNLWDSINYKRAPWESNPWVWVVTFKTIQ